MCGSGPRVIFSRTPISKAFRTLSIPKRSSEVSTRFFGAARGPPAQARFATPSAIGITPSAARSSAASGAFEMPENTKSGWSASTVAAYRQSNPRMLAEVAAGLSAPQKELPPKYFYDHRGSELFEEITRLPEYYPTRIESALLAAYCDEVGLIAGKGRAVVEFGSGSSLKTPRLLSCVAPSAYVPIDISGEFLRESAAALQKSFPDLPIVPVEANFMHPVSLPGGVSASPKLGFFPGSTIGNLVPRSGVNLLRDMIETMGVGSMLLIGMDRVKDTDLLIRAYDDEAGVTAAFNLNLLERINRELGADIAVQWFKHRAVWNDT